MDETILAGVRILIVDDSYDTRESIRILLKQRGAEVTAVGTAAEAFDAAAAGSHDVMLTDIALPDADGFELLRRVRARQQPGGGRVPAVAFTAFSSIEHQRRAFDAGFDDYLAKPVDLDALVAAVLRLVRDNTPCC